jgi:hypothetical protein
MFRRERLIGLGRHGYLLAKFLSLAGSRLFKACFFTA